MAEIKPQPGGRRIDAVVADLLAEPVDPVTRADVLRFEATLKVFRSVARGGDDIDPPTLVDRILAGLMPRLSDPGLLRVERRRAVLEQIARDLREATAHDPQSRGGLLVLRHELRRLARLRRRLDCLVSG